MIDAIKRMQLQRKGLSCGKKRREKNASALVTTLRYNKHVRSLVFAGFVACVIALVLGASTGSVVFANDPAKAVIVVLILTAVAIVQQKVAHAEVFRHNTLQLLIFGLVLLQVGMIRALHWVIELNHGMETLKFLLLPFALAPMTLTVLLGRNVGMFAATFSTLLGCLLVPSEWLFVFLITGLLVGLLGVYLTHDARRRGAIVRAGFYCGLASVAMLFLLGMLAPYPVSEFTPVDWQTLGIQMLCGLIAGIFSGILVSGCLPFLEAVFNVTTDIGWVELSDLNHPLLKRMSLEAPGTYQHSLMVAHLSETAAEAIGANATMCRASAYFHDIGKLNKPGYFIENAAVEQNPHDDLTPTMSALVIIAHVKDGVDLAIKHHLNQEIIDIILQHHGTTLVYYFYRKAIEGRDEFKARVAEGKANEDDIPEVSRKNFRYPGPKPQFRESAIVSLADSVESASRTLQKPTPPKIEQLVDEIVRNRINDGQLDECDLTLRELDEIKRSFVSTLRSIMHTRIVYPKDDSGDDKDKGSRSEKVSDQEGKAERPKTERLSGARAKSRAPSSTGKKSRIVGDAA
jgi:putative nucleotidyltransferase with HDIG domain